MLIYRHNDYPKHNKPFLLLQEAASKTLIAGMAVLAAILFVLLARHYSLLWPGIIGIFAVTIFANFIGLLKTKANFVEIGFKDEFFYMVSVYDIAFKKEVHYYPLNFAAPSREGANIYINYQGQIVRLKHEDWQDWEEIWYRINNPEPKLPDNINIA